MIAATIETRHNAAGGPLATVPHPPDGESFSMVFERESDGRWLAEVPELPGVMADGTSEQDDEVNVTVLALRVIADRTGKSERPRNLSAFWECVAERVGLKKIEKYTGLKPEGL
jgi:predicted RNase H-like HicB family nuclease